ncbi:unnamed protein product [Arabis nemorensis]|uniref:Uncharacterized protein n=1 Tax=Arabis nemorensis TaxID=586526 RepID=A0A565CKY6_9BRAS|nr:unnamed protein product [Arabis nemorensis]
MQYELDTYCSDHAKANQSVIKTMEPEQTKFGGPRELCGAVDLISQYKLLQHYEFFCKRSLPASLSDAHYLHNVVGDTEIRKGEGMQLDQLIENMSQSRETNTRIQPFDIDELKEAFQLNDMTPVELAPKRKHDGDEDLNDVQRHKKNKHKSSKLDEMGAIRVAG